MAVVAVRGGRLFDGSASAASGHRFSLDDAVNDAKLEVYVGSRAMYSGTLDQPTELGRENDEDGGKVYLPAAGVGRLPHRDRRQRICLDVAATDVADAAGWPARCRSPV